MSIKGPDVARYADMFNALGTEPRLRIMRQLLSAHPDGLVVGDIQGELAITGSVPLFRVLHQEPDPQSGCDRSDQAKGVNYVDQGSRQREIR
jgi:hypothetical protein